MESVVRKTLIAVLAGRFNIVETSVVFQGAFGCDVFAGEATLQNDVEFRGFACDIRGKPYLLRARFVR